MRNGILKWGAVFCAIMLLPWATMAFAAAAHMPHGCTCCQGCEGSGGHHCGMQGKSGPQSNCSSCSHMPMLPAVSGNAPIWQALPHQFAQVDVLKMLFARHIFHPPKIS